MVAVGRVDGFLLTPIQNTEQQHTKYRQQSLLPDSVVTALSLLIPLVYHQHKDHTVEISWRFVVVVVCCCIRAGNLRDE